MTPSAKKRLLIVFPFIVQQALAIPLAAAQCPAAAHLNDDATGTSRTALVLNDPESLKDAFSFAAVVKAILKSSGMEDSDANADAFVTTMIDTFGVTGKSNDGVEMPIDQRPEELKLVAGELLRGEDAQRMHPVGVFNRLDLAPHHWSNCGEYRVVFARRQEDTNPPKQFLLIFEAKLPAENAGEALTLSARQARCTQVATFWAELGKLEDKTSIVSKLQTFYFTGLQLADGKSLAPVISAANLGVEQGQIRGNIFLGLPWQLREWRVEESSEVLSFAMYTVKSNPLAEFYGDAPAAGTNPDAKTKRWRGFNDDFIGTHVRELLTPELEGKAANAVELTANLGLNSADPVNEFQSTSNDTDEPSEIALGNSNLRQSIATKLGQLGSKAADITGDHVLARAGAMTCGGCHRFSAGDQVSAAVAWPGDLGFKHIDDRGNLSPALQSHFLKARMGMLKKATCGIFGVEPDDKAVKAPALASADAEDADIVAMRALRAKIGASKAEKAVRSSAVVEADVVDFGRTMKRIEQAKPGAFRTVRPVH
jgi:hypothetical protein